MAIYSRGGMACGSARSPNFGCVRVPKTICWDFAQENSGVHPLSTTEDISAAVNAMVGMHCDASATTSGSVVGGQKFH